MERKKTQDQQLMIRTLGVLLGIVISGLIVLSIPALNGSLIYYAVMFIQLFWMFIVVPIITLGLKLKYKH